MTAVPSPLRAATPEPLRALIVDDDELDRLSVRRHLRAAGFEVTATECDDAPSALAALERGTFDCVVLDFNLPTHDGLYVLRELRARQKRLPVIVLTGQENAEIAVELMKSGASDYLAKVTLTSERLGHSVRTAARLHRAEAAALSAQESLRASEELNRRILASSEDCITVIDLDGRVLVLSEGGARVLGIDPVDVLGQTWVTQWAEASREEALQAFECARAGGKGRVIGCHPSATNPRAWWDVVLTPILGANGQPEKVLSIAREITELKRREEFEQQLVGIVSHDLRNPLNAILLGAELMQRTGGLEERHTRSLKRIRSSADRAVRLIRDLLDFTRARLGGSIPIQRESTDYAQLVSHVVDEVRMAWPERTIVWTGPEQLPGHADPDRMSQVLTNLLSNALQYSPPGTQVTCIARQHGDDAVISVHNLGEPIPEHVLPTLFEPLQRVAQAGDNAARSIGLGLYIVRQLVRAHGGTIDVRSAAGEGTTFSVRVPLREAAATGVSASE